jgi:hypothetical protein
VKWPWQKSIDRQEMPTQWHQNHPPIHVVINLKIKKKRLVWCFLFEWVKDWPEMTRLSQDIHCFFILAILFSVDSLQLLRLPFNHNFVSIYCSLSFPSISPNFGWSISGWMPMRFLRNFLEWNWQ